MNRGYPLLLRKIYANPLLCDYGISRHEAWLYIINVLPAGMDDEKSGLSRGKFSSSSRYLAAKWNWPRTTVQRFFKELEAAGMVARINTDLCHQADQPAGHFAGQYNGVYLLLT